jgi:hypothetical protein
VVGGRFIFWPQVHVFPPKRRRPSPKCPFSTQGGKTTRKNRLSARRRSRPPQVSCYPSNNVFFRTSIVSAEGMKANPSGVSRFHPQCAGEHRTCSARKGVHLLDLGHLHPPVMSDFYMQSMRENRACSTRDNVTEYMQR